VTIYPFTNYFEGFHNVEIIKRLFGDKTEDVLTNLKIEFRGGKRGYMGVSDDDGHLRINAHYLNNGDVIDIYLDIIHELVHVKQFMEGKKLFDRSFRYIERPTELEAFKFSVKEARNLGLSEERICEYLRTEWMNDDDLVKLAENLDVKYKKSN
jgi:hypothetical protein